MDSAASSKPCRTRETAPSDLWPLQFGLCKPLGHTLCPAHVLVASTRSQLGQRNSRANGAGSPRVQRVGYIAYVWNVQRGTTMLVEANALSMPQAVAALLVAARATEHWEPTGGGTVGIQRCTCGAASRQYPRYRPCNGERLALCQSLTNGLTDAAGGALHSGTFELVIRWPPHDGGKLTGRPLSTKT